MIKNFKDILRQMNRIFPVNECTIKTKEQAIYEGNTEYLCMIIDKRFKNNIEFRIMKPYIWVGAESNIKGSENEVLYGWIDKNGNWIDNFEKPIHDWDEYVVGFIKYENVRDESIWDFIPKCE